MQMTRRFALRQILARKQSFYKLLASFFVMLILPLVLVLANYFYARGLLQQENINYQNAVLTQAQMSMDERLQTIQLYAIDLSNDTVLNATLSQRQADDSQGNFELWELSRHLQSYSATAGSFCDTTIYSRLYDCMVSGSYVDYRVSEGSLRMPSEEMNRSLLELLQNERSYCQFYLLGDSQGHSQLVMLHSVPLWSSGAASYGTICLRIDGDGLFSTIRDMEELQSGLVCRHTFVRLAYHGAFQFCIPCNDRADAPVGILQHLLQFALIVLRKVVRVRVEAVEHGVNTLAHHFVRIYRIYVEHVQLFHHGVKYIHVFGQFEAMVVPTFKTQQNTNRQCRSCEGHPAQFYQSFHSFFSIYN